MPYIAIRITEEAAELLNDAARDSGKTKSQVIIDSLTSSVIPDIEALAAKHDALVAPKIPVSTPVSDDKSLTDGLFEDELPECCQGIYTGRHCDMCEHWTLRQGRYFNILTNRFIDDPIYVNYFQSL